MTLGRHARPTELECKRHQKVSGMFNFFYFIFFESNIIYDRHQSTRFESIWGTTKYGRARFYFVYLRWFSAQSANDFQLLRGLSLILASVGPLCRPSLASFLDAELGVVFVVAGWSVRKITNEFSGHLRRRFPICHSIEFHSSILFLSRFFVKSQIRSRINDYSMIKFDSSTPNIRLPNNAKPNQIY